MRFSSGAGTTQEAVKLVARKLSSIYGLGVTDSESLHVWLLEFGEDTNRLRTSVGVIPSYTMKTLLLFLS